jgi:hypothetical protein
MTARICEVEGCGAAHESNGYCTKHVVRFRRHGSPLAGGPFPDKTPRRWSLEPLLAAIGRTQHDLPGILNVSHDTVYIAATRGMRDYTADRWCCRFGYHPASIYGHEWFETAGEYE